VCGVGGQGRVVGRAGNMFTTHAHPWPVPYPPLFTARHANDCLGTRGNRAGGGKAVGDPPISVHGGR